MVSSLRTFAIAGISSLGLVVYLVAWFHWPVTLSLALGALMAMVVVMTSASLGGETEEADAAWRAAAADLLDPPPAVPTGEPDGRRSAEAAAARDAPRPVRGGSGQPPKAT